MSTIQPPTSDYQTNGPMDREPDLEFDQEGPVDLTDTGESDDDSRHRGPNRGGRGRMRGKARGKGRDFDPVKSAQLKKDLYNLPNLLTYLRVLLIPVFLIVLAEGSPKNSFLAACLFGFAAITDFLDGWLARRQNLVSMMGKFLDPLADKLLVTSALIILIPMGRIPAWVVIVLLMRELTVTGLRSIASAERMVISAGWAGKVKTGLQFPGLIGLFIHYSYPVNFGFFTATINYQEVGLVLILFSLVFSFWSAGEYFRAFFQQIANRKTPDH